jgi:hypothetical protein
MRLRPAILLLSVTACLPVSCRDKPPAAASQPSAPYVANKRSRAEG